MEYFKGIGQINYEGPEVEPISIQVLQSWWSNYG